MYRNKYYKEILPSKKRWNSYWHQINEIINKNPISILEIGVGNKFIFNFLRQNNFNIKTLDIEEKLKPDYVASIDTAQLPNNSFELILCAEVLEHLPFDLFEKSLVNMYNITKKYVILSIPDDRRPIIINIQIPFIKFRFLIKFPIFKKNFKKGGHYWEIGRKGYELNKIRKKIKDVGFKIQKDYCVFENHWHHFFILKKYD